MARTLQQESDDLRRAWRELGSVLWVELEPPLAALLGVVLGACTWVSRKLQ